MNIISAVCSTASEWWGQGREVSVANMGRTISCGQAAQTIINNSDHMKQSEHVHH